MLLTILRLSDLVTRSRRLTPMIRMPKILYSFTQFWPSLSKRTWVLRRNEQVIRSDVHGLVSETGYIETQDNRTVITMRQASTILAWLR